MFNAECEDVVLHIHGAEAPVKSGHSGSRCMEFQTRMFGIPNIGLSTWASRGLDHFVRELVENRNMRRQISLVKGKKGPRSLKKKFQN